MSEKTIKVMMDRGALLNALEKVVPGLTSEGVLEQSDSFVFTGGRVITYNDKICVSYPVEIGGWEGAVKAQKLLAILGKMEAAEVMIEVLGGELRIGSKKSRMGLPCQSVVNLPMQDVKPPEGGDPAWLDIPNDFNVALKFCMFSASRDPVAEPVLSCLHVTENYVESCDDCRATRSVMSGSIGEREMMIPRGIASELSKYNVIKTAEDDAFVHFLMADDAIFSFRKVSGGYPALGELLSVEGAELVLPDGLSGVLDRAGIFSGDNDDNFVELTIDKGILTVSGKGNSGWYQEREKVGYAGAAVQFFVNPDFLKEALAVMKVIHVGDGRIGMRGENFFHAVSLSANPVPPAAAK